MASTKAMIVPRRRYRPDRSRARILAAAEELFAARGYAGTSVRSVARRARVPASLLYHHFGDKERLFLEVQRRLFARFLDAMHGLDAADPPTPERVRVFLGGFFDALASSPNVLRLEPAARRGAAGKIQAAALAEMFDAGADYVRRGIASGLLRPVEPRHLMLVFFGMLKAVFVEDDFRRVLYGEPELNSERLAGLRRTIVDVAVHTIFPDQTRPDDGGRRSDDTQARDRRRGQPRHRAHGGVGRPA